MEQLGLFSAPEPPARPAAPPSSKRERDRVRWQNLIDHGSHPLVASSEISGVYLHPDAPRDLDETTPGPRCGSCVHRRAARYPKCWDTTTGLRVTSGAASDVRTYWPACRQYEPKGGAT